MRPSHLVVRAFTYYRRTTIAAVLGVATAVAVLGGALLVGESVRGSLRDLVLQRLGRTDQVVLSTGFFRDELTNELRDDPAFSKSFGAIAPMILADGVVSDQTGSRRSSVSPSTASTIASGASMSRRFPDGIGPQRNAKCSSARRSPTTLVSRREGRC